MLRISLALCFAAFLTACGPKPLESSTFATDARSVFSKKTIDAALERVRKLKKFGAIPDADAPDAKLINTQHAQIERLYKKIAMSAIGKEDAMSLRFCASADCDGIGPAFVDLRVPTINVAAKGRSSLRNLRPPVHLSLRTN